MRFKMKRDGRTLGHKTLEELRRIAVRRVIEDKVAASQVAAELGFCRTYSALHKYLHNHQAAFAAGCVTGK